VLDDKTFPTLDPLIDKALDMPADQRAQFLEKLAVEHPEIASHISRLLGRMDSAEGFLDCDAAIVRDEFLIRSLEQLKRMGTQDTLQPGDELGPYRIDDMLGRGLYATVYLATRQEEGWTQQVALKLMVRGVNTDDVLRRFFSERQILSKLRYPGICTLLDGGLTEDGLPYFVMEYIDGDSITEFCFRRSLDLTARIRLFQEACEAVGKVHRHLVVHRDIKPSNILVTREGQVKLLDFGIAKLLEPEIAGSAAVTQMESRPMTPAYASPEQLKGEAVTTATDVYQLGLLLTEMLSGVDSPLNSLGIKDGSHPSREPSRVVDTDGPGLPYPIAALKGDLDWIVLKCLEPDPADRYGSAEELGAEIQRYLKQRPVLARRATFPYLVRKFISRRPGLALSGAVALIAVLVFVAMLSQFNINLALERTAAIDAANRAEQVKGLLVRFLTSADPYRGSGADTKVSELLADSEQGLFEELSNQPELQAELFGTLADVYSSLSLPEESARLRQHQMDLLFETNGPASFEVIQARRKLVLARSRDEGTQATLQSLESVLSELVAKHPDQWLERARVNYDLGSLLHTYGRDDDAVRFAERAVTILREEVESLDDLADSLVLLGTVSHNYEETLVYHRQAAQILAGHRGPEHPATLIANISVASTLSDLARFEDSLTIFDRVIPVLEQELGPLHEQTLNALNNRSVCLSRMGDTEAAISGFREVLRRDRQVHGSEHRDVAVRLQNLGAMLNREERFDEAIEALTEAARIHGIVNLPGNPAPGFPHITLADIHGKLGNVTLLEFHARKALEHLQGNMPDDHHAILKCRCLLGDALIRQGRQAEGVAMVEGVLENLGGREVANTRLAGECGAVLATTR